MPQSESSSALPPHPTKRQQASRWTPRPQLTEETIHKPWLTPLDQIITIKDVATFKGPFVTIEKRRGTKWREQVIVAAFSFDDLLEVVVDLVSNRNSAATADRHRRTFHFVLTGRWSTGKCRELARSKSFKVADPTTPTSRARAQLERIRRGAVASGLIELPANSGEAWYTLRFVKPPEQQ